jgi:hypothetical protein
MTATPAIGAITLPGGFWLDGVHHRDALLRPLTGEDEAFLAEASALLPARRTTLLLARCLTRLGPLDAATDDAVRSLTVGDREALLLHLRRLALGDRLQCVLRCPEAGCGEPMDLDLDVRDLLSAPYGNAAPLHDAEIEGEGTVWRIRFRLPTGADQEEAAPLARTDPAAAAELILARCIETAEREDGGPVASLSAEVAERLGERMSELDPQAELTLSLSCPTCGRDFTAVLDAGSFVFDELAGSAPSIYREVHRLAFYYHWSEAEILRLTGSKRRLYLDLLAETLGGEGRR